MGVDDVERRAGGPAGRARRAAVAAAQLSGRPRERPRAGRELVQLDLEPVQARAARRPGRGRSVPRSGCAASGRMFETHERAHDPPTVALWVRQGRDGGSRGRGCQIFLDGPSGMMARVASVPVNVGSSIGDPRGRPIGVFDSGVGGLTVLHELLVQAAARGLPIPGRHRALSLRRTHAGGARRASRRRSPRSCSGAARSCWWWRATRRPPPRCRPAPADDGDDARHRRARRRASGGAAGGGGDAHGADRAAGHADDGRQRRLRGGCRRDRPTRDATRGGRARRWRRSSRLASSSTSAPCRLCARRARRCASRSRHGDPRLHALPADPADAPADARPAGDARQLRRGARAPGGARAEHARASEPAGRARATTAFCARATQRRSSSWARASCRCRWVRSSTSSSRRSR